VSVAAAATIPWENCPLVLIGRILAAKEDFKMGSRLYRLFIEPRQHDADIRNREIVLNMLLASTLGLLLLAVLLLAVLWVGFKDPNVSATTIGIALAAVFVGSLYRLSRFGYYRLAAALLVGLYFLLATAVVYFWGIATPAGPLLYGLVIVLAGILLGPQYSVYFAGSITLLLMGLQLAAEHGVIHPDWSWLASPPNMADAIGFGLIYAVLAVVSWLFNHQMERSLRRAEQAEIAVTKQKDSLETTVQERTRELQAVQLEKIQQMYRFAELGQLSTALLHDLANHLTTLTIDIEGLEGKTRSRALGRAKRSIHYIDDMVVRVRDQLHGRSDIRTFSAIQEVEAMVAMLRSKASAAGVTINWHTTLDKRTARLSGEPIRFRQLMANLLSNGIDAYDGFTSKRREVIVDITDDESNVVITINDWGKGISVAQRPKLFEPFYSTKQTGMGMGLYIVQQIAEEHFLGSVTIDQSKKHTAFVITLPKASS
jgi:signal transduction histidine kinase